MFAVRILHARHRVPWQHLHRTPGTQTWCPDVVTLGGHWFLLISEISQRPHLQLPKLLLRRPITNRFHCVCVFNIFYLLFF